MLTISPEDDHARDGGDMEIGSKTLASTNLSRGEKTEDDDGATLHQQPAGPTLKDAHGSVGLALIEQGTAIPTTGERMIATRLEDWLYIVYCA